MSNDGRGGDTVRGRGTVVAGIGNEYRRDDGVGPAVAALLAAGTPGVRDVGPVVEPLDLLGRWDGAELAVIIDAVRSPEPAGTVNVVDLGTVERAASATSSHGVDLAGAVRIALAVGRAPGRVVVVGVVGVDFSNGPGLSPDVEAAVPAAAAAALAEMRGAATGA